MDDRRGNQFLAIFPDATLALLKGHLSNVSLPQGAVCFDAGDITERVYFPTTGLISLVICTQGGDLVEAGMVGREGAAGLQSVVTRRPSFTRAIVQVPGLFWTIPAEPLRHAIEKSEEAKALVNRYTEILWSEAQQLAACNAIHQSSARLARWLLLSADRTGSNNLLLTQEFLGEMLGIRRTSVTLLAQEIQQRGVIKYSRGKIAILDRATLEATACECYQVIRRLYHEGLAATEEASIVPRDTGDQQKARPHLNAK